MSEKETSTITFKELKENRTAELLEIGEHLNTQDEMQLAINCELALSTIKRYTSGNIKEVRKFEIADKIIEQGNKLLNSKVI